MYPDNIPPEIGFPLAAILWLVLFAMILSDRRKLNRALKERPSLKIFDRDSGEWVTPKPQKIFDQDDIDTKESAQ